ncbi:vacuolar transporter chaperone [Rhizophlyctis rosea]|nr:vacuolar transporter chaperone [Rhizophlyctis rosea]
MNGRRPLANEDEEFDEELDNLNATKNTSDRGKNKAQSTDVISFLPEHLPPEWQTHSLDYEKLQELLLLDDFTVDDEQKFVAALEYAVVKDTYLPSIFKARVLRSKTVVDILKDEVKAGPTVTSALRTRDAKLLQTGENMLLGLIDTARKLSTFVRLNYSTAWKILTDHDIFTQFKVKQKYLDKFGAKEFEEEELDPTIRRLFQACSIIKRKANERAEQESVDAPDVARRTTKYWVHPGKLLTIWNNVAKVKRTILQNLPEVIDCDTPNPAITSIYLDDTDFSLYHERMSKEEGAQAIRIRWYGEDPSPSDEIYIERETHHENWTGLESVKEHFSIKEKYAEDVLESRWDVEKGFHKWRESATKKGDDKALKEVEKAERLAREVQETIRKRELKPMIRSFYKRTEFQTVGDPRVRISLDTDLHMVREDDEEADRRLGGWRRPDVGTTVPLGGGKLKPEDVCVFPYAVLEVKIQTHEGGEPPEWIMKLVESDLVKAVPEFFKFGHGVAALRSSNVSLLPYWLVQMENDIRGGRIWDVGYRSTKDTERVEIEERVHRLEYISACLNSIQLKKILVKLGRGKSDTTAGMRRRLLEFVQELASDAELRKLDVLIGAFEIMEEDQDDDESAAESEDLQRGSGAAHQIRKEARAAAARQRRTDGGHSKIVEIAQDETINLEQHHIEKAKQYFDMALERGFLRGHSVALVCGVMYKKLRIVLDITPPPVATFRLISKYVDLLDFGEDRDAVEETAHRWAERMEYDFLQSGRKVTGICSACLFIAARTHGFNRSVREISERVGCDAQTLRKRIAEIAETPSAQLSVHDFSDVWLETAEEPPAFARSKRLSENDASGDIPDVLNQWKGWVGDDDDDHLETLDEDPTVQNAINSDADDIALREDLWDREFGPWLEKRRLKKQAKEIRANKKGAGPSSATSQKQKIRPRPVVINVDFDAIASLYIKEPIAFSHAEVQKMIRDAPLLLAEESRRAEKKAKEKRERELVTKLFTEPPMRLGARLTAFWKEVVTDGFERRQRLKQKERRRRRDSEFPDVEYDDEVVEYYEEGDHEGGEGYGYDEDEDESRGEDREDDDDEEEHEEELISQGRVYPLARAAV